MQARMKMNQLTPLQIREQLISEKVGRIGTLNLDGTPYIVPVHFVLHKDKIYIHGLSKGQKNENIRSNNNVCFEVDCMRGLIMHEEPCHVNTSYQSVIINGIARLVACDDTKKMILNLIVDKYTPSLSGKELPLQTVIKTSIIEIEILNCTGKYFG
ncbi:pyridoxamine 5'-phosphate oxidase family protein [Parabacteroides hominis]|uniref:Pyridoxamine 5'-phosphate oxidase family protein n=1 Tax=Parabacteroides hominis TaxID=2763057 RepID=A0ABR7DMK3_9BACT|nr:pyridoxamine 5'-phosphate oxidase family protein [Parabacteroides hominis]MBC5632651.1 pyridoxamine 5'-phosphate oxidase family protein [Parabacteroides hominis]